MEKPTSPPAAASASRSTRRPRTSPWQAIALVHPGPSLLVTASLVAAAGAARHAVPGPGESLRLAVTMLPIQLAIGALNDLCDQGLDRSAGRRTKPLVSGAVRPRTAALVTVLGFALGLGAATTLPLPAVLLAAVAALAGAGYDLGLKRGALSWVPWWAGFTALPLLGWAAAGVPLGRLAAAVPGLTLGLALSLQLANALPDIAGDRSGGSSGLGVRLGPRWSRRASLGLAALTAAAALSLSPILGQAPWLVGAGVAPLMAGSLLLAVRPRIRPFPVLAAGAGVMATFWLVAL